MKYLTWEDVAMVHRLVQRGIYRCEKEIFEREAELMNKVIDRGKMARCAARKQAAKPGATRVIPDKRKKAPKHRKPLKEE